MYASGREVPNGTKTNYKVVNALSKGTCTREAARARRFALQLTAV
jgi:hypothetical protein